MAFGMEVKKYENKPIAKYDARAGKMFRDEEEISDKFQAIFDLEQVEVGWLRFATGQAPSFHVVRIGQTIPARPSEDHKEGFRVNLKMGKSCGSDVREFASCASCVLQAMDDLHTAYLSAPESKKGLLPVIKMGKPIAVKTTNKKTGQTSTNYRPGFEVIAWADRPADLPKADHGAVNGHSKADHGGKEDFDTEF